MHELTVPDRLRLPLQFEVAPLLTEAEAISSAAWVPHFNKRVHEGTWCGVTLRGPGGEAHRIYPDPTGQLPVADTPLLAHCPAAAAALSTLRCPVLIARFLDLGPGSTIHPHHDEGLGYDAGTVRLHVPLSGGPDVTFQLDGVPVAMAPGDCWYLDFRRPHAAANGSDRRRIHLVLDCRVDDWLTGLFARALAPSSGA